MTPTDLAVIAGGVAAIAWVNWYFFFAGTAAANAAVGPGGFQEVTIRVAGGYEPAHVRVKKGRPVRLIFDRQETSGCSEEIVFPQFGIKKFLPALKQTAIEIMPQEPGTYEFTCGMSMLRGKLTVENDGAERGDGNED